MKFSGLYICIVLIFTALNGKAQSSTGFSGQFSIQNINDLGDGQYLVVGAFVDQSAQYRATDASVGDRIIDASARMFEVVSLTFDGDLINATVKQLDGSIPNAGEGIIYHPTSKGLPLIANGASAGIIASTQNTLTVSLNNILPTYGSGNVLPASTSKTGDVIRVTSDSKIYRLESSGWKNINDIPYVFGLPESGNQGDVVYNVMDDIQYTYTGSSWDVIKELSALPTFSKYGDVFYNTGQQKLFMFDISGKWVGINSSSTSGGSDAELPVDSKPGSLFFNTDKNTLYVFDAAGKWVEVSINGSIPSGSDNPAIADNLIKTGSLYYNTTDSHLYFYNGTEWNTLVGLLNEGELYVGNTQGKAISTPKNVIPLSDFAAAAKDLSLGDGTANFKLINLADPTNDQDAATKKYVDTRVIVPSSLSLAADNFMVGDMEGKATGVLKNTIPLSGFAVPLADISMGGFVLTNLAAPLADEDASTKKYVDNLFKTPSSLLALPKDNFFVGNDAGMAAAMPKVQIPVSDFGKATATLNMGGGTELYNISFLKDPLLDQDAATKIYVDSKLSAPGAITLPTDNIFVGDAENKATGVLKSAIPLSDFAAANKDLILGDGTANFKITNLAEPVAAQDAATKNYIDTKAIIPSDISLAVAHFMVGDASGKATGILKNLIPLSGFALPLTDVSLGGFALKNLADPLLDQDAATKIYVDSKLSAPGAITLPTDNIFVGDAENKAMGIAKNAIPLSDFGAANKDLSIGDGTANFKITNLADPVNDQEAATKKYVDAKTATTAPSPAAPATGLAGQTYYNTTENRLYMYDGAQWVPMDNKLADGNFYVGNPAGVAVATPKNTIPVSGFGSAQNDVSMGNFKIINLVSPTADQDAATKKYVDDGLTLVAGSAKDNLGDHQARENVKLASFTISNDGGTDKGLAFEASGNAIFGQDLTIKGNMYTPSDYRLKTNIETLSDVLKKIDLMRGVRFEYKDQHIYAAGPKIGVIAQELQKVYPEMVTQGKDGFLKVDYTQLTGILIQAVKEQQKEINELKDALKNQQEQINSILKKLK